MGGDGTYYECMHVLLRRIQDEAGIDYNNPETSLKSPSIPLCLIPTGNTNYIFLKLFNTDLNEHKTNVKRNLETKFQ